MADSQDNGFPSVPLKDAAQQLRMGTEALRYHVSRKTIDSFKKNDRIYISVAEIERFQRERKGRVEFGEEWRERLQKRMIGIVESMQIAPHGEILVDRMLSLMEDMLQRNITLGAKIFTGDMGTDKMPFRDRKKEELCRKIADWSAE